MGILSFILLLCPLVLSKLHQPICHFPKEVLKCKDTSIFYTNSNGNVDLGVTEALGI